MAEGVGTHLELDVGGSFIGASYDPEAAGVGTSNTTGVKPVGTLGFYSDVLGEQFRFGLTIGVPQVTGGSWSREEAAAEITRYYITDAAIFHISAVPALSYTPIPWLTIGAGINIVHGRWDAELDKDLGSVLNQTVGSNDPDGPIPYAHPDLAAPTILSTSGWGVGAVVGLLVRPVEQLSIGASLHTPVAITTSGTVEVEYSDYLVEFAGELLPGVELPELSGDITIPMDLPLQVVAGVAYRPTPELEFAVDYRYQQKTTGATVDVHLVRATSPSINDTTLARATRDSHQFGLRAEYQVVPELRLAVGFRYGSNAVPETAATPSNLDTQKYEVGIGARVQLTEEVMLVGQYAHTFIPDLVVENSLHRPLAQPSLATFNHPSPLGRYAVSADTLILGVALTL